MYKSWSKSLLHIWVISWFDSYLNNHFNLHVCLSILFRLRAICPCVQKLTPVFAVGSQNVTNRSFLVCVKSEKYALWVTLRPLGSIRQGEPEIHAILYCARGSQAALIKLTSVFYHFPSVGHKQLCALAHLGCTLAAGTSRYIYVYSFF